MTAYVYVLDTLADWELGYVTSELNSARFFKKDAGIVSVKTVSYSREPIVSMGGLRILPDCTIDELVASEENLLLLPGANTWNEARHEAIIKKAGEFLESGATVCAICGATAALANRGLLDTRAHTSNGPGYLEMVAPGYTGQSLYRNGPSVADGNLITAGATGALSWAKRIIERAGVFQSSTLEAWYEYFRTGEPKHFFDLMRSLPTAAVN